MIDVLFICTANRCRSPMAQVLLTHELEARGLAGRVRSVGLREPGAPPSDGAIRALGALGAGLDAHRSATLAAEQLRQADLVLGMEREHVRRAVLLERSTLPRAFTLKDLVRRAELTGPRPDGVDLEAWLRTVAPGRGPRDLVGERRDEDIADPVGRPDAAYRATAAELGALVTRLVDLVRPELPVSYDG